MVSLAFPNWILVVCAAWIPLLLYVYSFRQVARAVNAAGGGAPAGAVWLLLIPIFNYVWFFAMLFRLRAAVRRSGNEPPGNHWFVLGCTAGAIHLAQVLTGVLMHTDMLFVQAGIWLVWWVIGIFHWFRLEALQKTFETIATPA